MVGLSSEEFLIHIANDTLSLIKNLNRNKNMYFWNVFFLEKENYYELLKKTINITYFYIKLFCSFEKRN